METRPNAEQQLRDLALGRLTEEERDAVFLAIFENPDNVDAAEAVEYELARDYVAGELSPRDAEAFARQLQQNAGLAAKVEQARVLRAIPAETAAKPAEPSFWERMFGGFRLPVVQFATACAAVAGIAIGVSQLNQNRALEERLTATLLDQQKLRDEVAKSSLRGYSLPAQFLLEPGLTRSEGRKRIQLPVGNVAIKLQLAGVVPGNARSYRIRLETPEGIVVASAESTLPEITIAPNVLKARSEYVIAIEAVQATGAVVRLPSYALATAQ